MHDAVRARCMVRAWCKVRHVSGALRATCMVRCTRGAVCAECMVRSARWMVRGAWLVVSGT
eukprot:14033943-Alexandrium_andersonii.AAC.1